MPRASLAITKKQFNGRNITVSRSVSTEETNAVDVKYQALKLRYSFISPAPL